MIGRIFVVEEDYYRNNWQPRNGFKHKKIAISQMNLYKEIAKILRINTRFRIKVYIPEQ